MVDSQLPSLKKCRLCLVPVFRRALSMTWASSSTGDQDRLAGAWTRGKCQVAIAKGREADVSAPDTSAVDITRGNSVPRKAFCSLPGPLGHGQQACSGLWTNLLNMRLIFRE